MGKQLFTNVEIPWGAQFTKLGKVLASLKNEYIEDDQAIVLFNGIRKISVCACLGGGTGVIAGYLMGRRWFRSRLGASLIGLLGLTTGIELGTLYGFQQAKFTWESLKGTRLYHKLCE